MKPNLGLSACTVRCELRRRCACSTESEAGERKENHQFHAPKKKGKRMKERERERERDAKQNIFPSGFLVASREKRAPSSFYLPSRDSIRDGEIARGEGEDRQATYLFF